MECGTTCLRMICKYYGKDYSAETMQRLCMVTRDGVSLLGISETAEYLGLRTVCGRTTQKKLIEQRPFPCILHWNQDHFVVLYDVKKNQNDDYVFILLIQERLFYNLMKKHFEMLGLVRVHIERRKVS